MFLLFCHSWPVIVVRWKNSLWLNLATFTGQLGILIKNKGVIYYLFGDAFYLVGWVRSFK